MRLDRLSAAVVLGVGLFLGGVVGAAPPTSKPVEPVQPDANVKAPLRRPPTKPAELGPEHAILSGFAGHWKWKLHPIPDAATAATPDSVVSGPPDTEGTAEGKLLMGGRFAEVRHEGTVNGQKFEAMMLCGFDAVINRYASTWIDNASNAMVHFVGTYDPGKKQLTMTAHYSDPATRRLTIAKTVTTFVDATTWTYDEYVSHAVGERESHTMTITFKKG